MNLMRVCKNERKYKIREEKGLVDLLYEYLFTFSGECLCIYAGMTFQLKFTRAWLIRFFCMTGGGRFGTEYR